MTSTRERLLYAAANLLESGGRGSVSTRAVCAAAGVKSPTLYRLFGDKEKLLDAVAAHGFREYLASKEALGETDDPVGDLRRGWDLHVDFGLTKPAFYTLMYGEVWPAANYEAKQATLELLQRRIARVAEAGLLRMSVKRAAQVFYAGNVGVVIALLSMSPEVRDPELSATTREQVLRTITNGDATPPNGSTAGLAVALREALSRDKKVPLSPTEKALLADWLDRVADGT